MFLFPPQYVGSYIYTGKEIYIYWSVSTASPGISARTLVKQNMSVRVRDIGGGVAGSAL